MLWIQSFGNTTALDHQRKISRHGRIDMEQKGHSTLYKIPQLWIINEKSVATVGSIWSKRVITGKAYSTLYLLYIYTTALDDQRKISSTFVTLYHTTTLDH